MRRHNKPSECWSARARTRRSPWNSRSLARSSPEVAPHPPAWRLASDPAEAFMTTPLRQAYAATTWESPNAIVRLGRSWLGRVLRLGQFRGLPPRPRLARPGTGAAGDRVQRGYWSAASSRSSALSPTAMAWAPGCSRPSSGWMVALRRLAAHDCAARGRSRRWWPCRLART